MQRLMGRRTLRAACLGLFLVLALVLPHPAAGSAAVRNVTLTGLVTGERGQPLAGAEVEVFRMDGVLAATATTGPDGGFTAWVPAAGGALWVRAWAPGHDTVERVWAGAGEAPVVHLELPPLTGGVSGDVIGPGGAPVAGARVELIRVGYGLVDTATTTAGGRFRFREVPVGGQYQVRVVAEGLAPAAQPVPAIPAAGDATVQVRLSPFRGEVRGWVVDRVTGKPIPGAAVAVERSDLGVVARAETDVRGEFAVTVPAAVPPGAATFRLQVEARGYAPRETEPFALDAYGRALWTGARQLELEPLTATVTGRVLNEDGEPLAGAPLWLEREDTGIVAETATAADGTFQFTVAPADGVRVRVRAVPVKVTEKSEVKHRPAAQTEWLVPRPGQVANLSLALTERNIEDYGDGHVRGLVRDPKGQPVAGVTVELIRTGDGVVARTETGADGSYLFSRVEANLPHPDVAQSPYAEFLYPPGNGYVVRVSGSGYYPAASETVDVRPEQDTVVDLTISPLTAQVAGQAVGSDGRPLAGAEVRLRPAAGGEERATRTGPDGTFRLRAPAPGTYVLEVSLSGYRPALVPAITLTPGVDRTVDLRLTPATGTVAGRVLDSAGRPLAGTRVTALAADGSLRSTAAGNDGSYRLEEVPAGIPVLLSATHSSAATGGPAGPVTVAPGEELPSDLSLRATAGTVAGLVVNPAGQPAAGVTVELWRAGAGRVAVVQTGSDGRFRFPSVVADPDSRYAVRVAVPGHGYREAGRRSLPPLFLVQPGETRNLVLTLVPLQ